MTAVALIGIALFGIWAQLGRRAYHIAEAGRLFERRLAASLLPFVTLALLVPLAVRVGSWTVGGVVVGALAAVTYVVYVARDPLRGGFWHHRRLRKLGTVACVVAGAVAARFVPAPEVVPLAFAALVFHRHQRIAADLVVQQLADGEAQRLKLLSFRAEARHATLAAADDRTSKAG